MKKAIIFAAAALCVFSYSRFSAAQAAQSNTNTFITWHANTFYPSDFKGKALPVGGSTVSASVTLLKDGRMQDLSRKTITWYLNGDYYAEGKGLDEISFPIRGGLGSTYSARAVIQDENNSVDALAVVPVFRPIVVIDAPYPAGEVPENSSVSVSAIPYFFSVSSIGSLSFLWNVNGVARPNESGQTIVLNIGSIGSGKPVSLQSIVTNTKSIAQSAAGEAVLTTQ